MAKQFILLLLVAVASCALETTPTPKTDKVILCHYNSASFQRPGPGKMPLADLEPALSLCTHLLYGHAGLRVDNHKIQSLNPMIDLDLDGSNGHYRLITQLKAKFPKLKVILSVGGNADRLGNNPDLKYLELLESSAARLSFVNSAHALISSYQFDGIDLAWQFPATPPAKAQTSGLGSLWAGVKAFVGSAPFVDEKVDEHNIGFIHLLREIKASFGPENLIVSVTVNPNVPLTYFDLPVLFATADLVTLPTYDYWTAVQTPNEANHPAALVNGKFVVVDEVIGTHDERASKTILAIPTFGRTWKLEPDSSIPEVPPVRSVKHPGNAGLLTATPGLLSYPEVCAAIKDVLPLQKANDGSAYAYRLPTGHGEHGLWVGYEDEASARAKVEYAKTSKLGGIAIVSVDLDDFGGSCGGEKFPILQAAKKALDA